MRVQQMFYNALWVADCFSFFALSGTKSVHYSRLLKGCSGQHDGAMLASAVTGTASPKSFIYVHRVTYSDCTAGDHVYYGRYLDMLEAARGAFFRDAGLPLSKLQQAGSIFPVVECRLQYKRPARYDEVLEVRTLVTRADGVRINFGYQITNETGALILEGETWHVCTGLEGKPKRLPAELAGVLQRMPVAG